MLRYRGYDGGNIEVDERGMMGDTDIIILVEII